MEAASILSAWTKGQWKFSRLRPRRLMRRHPEVRRKRHLVARLHPAMGRARLLFRVHRIGEKNRLVVGQAAQHLLVTLDKGGLLGLIGRGRQALGRLVLEAQAVQQLGLSPNGCKSPRRSP